jgi:hypothetical protein
VSLVPRSPLLFLLLVALLVFGLERLIVTDTEAIEQLARDAAQAIRVEAWGQLESLLHEDFDYEGRDRAATLEHVRSLARKYKPIDVGITVVDVKVDGDEATARGVVRATAMGRTAQVPVDASFRRTADGWRLAKVRGGGYVR